MQAGVHCKCSTHAMKHKYPASCILWEEQMLAFRLVLCINKSPSVVIGGLCLLRLSNTAKALNRYSKERLSCGKTMP